MKSELLRAPALSSEPKYVWFAEHLRQQIAEGALKPGDRLPSRSEIRRLHQITQPTIERAQAILEREGLITRRERQGVFVAERSFGRAVVENGAARMISQTVAFLSPSEGRIKAGHRQSGWSDYLTQGALAQCRELGKNALFLHPAALQGEQLAQLLENPPLGFVLVEYVAPEDYLRVGQLLATLHQHGRPVAVFGNDLEFSAFDRVASDHESGCYSLTRFLIERGCRRILPFWPPQRPGLRWLEQRYAGYERAMREAGLELSKVCEVPQHHAPIEPDDTPEKFAATIRHKAGYLAEFLTGTSRCDAILEVTDGEVPSTAAACRLLGREPNRDILIAGYDNYWRDIRESEFESTIPLATMDKHNAVIGQELVNLLLARATGMLQDEPQLRWVQPNLLLLKQPADYVSGEAIRERQSLATAN